MSLDLVSTPPHAEDDSGPSDRELMGDHLERLRSWPQRFVTPGSSWLRDLPLRRVLRIH